MFVCLSSIFGSEHFAPNTRCNVGQSPNMSSRFLLLITIFVTIWHHLCGTNNGSGCNYCGPFTFLDIRNMYLLLPEMLSDSERLICFLPSVKMVSIVICLLWKWSLSNFDDLNFAKSSKIASTSLSQVGEQLVMTREKCIFQSHPKWPLNHFHKSESN